MSVPNAEKILSLLVDLYADQHNVKIKYHIEAKTEGGRRDGDKRTNNIDYLHNIDRVVLFGQ